MHWPSNCHASLPCASIACIVLYGRCHTRGHFTVTSEVTILLLLNQSHRRHCSTFLVLFSNIMQHAALLCHSMTKALLLQRFGNRNSLRLQPALLEAFLQRCSFYSFMMYSGYNFHFCSLYRMGLGFALRS